MPFNLHIYYQLQNNVLKIKQCTVHLTYTVHDLKTLKTYVHDNAAFEESHAIIITRNICTQHAHIQSVMYKWHQI